MVKSWVDGGKWPPHFKIRSEATHRIDPRSNSIRRGNSTQGEMPGMDRNIDEDIKAHLMQTDGRFRELAHQHLEYDRLVSELENKHVLTAQEEIEEHRLKKLKLHLKDEMEQMVSEQRMASAGA
jgi:uncharacterized protein YdcH (DUF465 family)